MKKCHECHQEIDKYAIACQYCGKLAEEREKSGTGSDPGTEDTGKKPKQDRDISQNEYFE